MNNSNLHPVVPAQVVVILLPFVPAVVMGLQTCEGVYECESPLTSPCKGLYVLSLKCHSLDPCGDPCEEVWVLYHGVFCRDCNALVNKFHSA